MHKWVSASDQTYCGFIQGGSVHVCLFQTGFHPVIITVPLFCVHPQLFLVGIVFVCGIHEVAATVAPDTLPRVCTHTHT